MADQLVVLRRGFSKIDIDAKKTGLIVNEEKTKYMYANRQKGRDRLVQNLTIDPYNLETVEHFK